MMSVPTSDELVAKVNMMAARAGVKMCTDCDNGRIVEQNEDGKVSWRTCPCRWEAE